MEERALWSDCPVCMEVRSQRQLHLNHSLKIKMHLLLCLTSAALRRERACAGLPDSMRPLVLCVPYPGFGQVPDLPNADHFGPEVYKSVCPYERSCRSDGKSCGCFGCSGGKRRLRAEVRWWDVRRRCGFKRWVGRCLLTSVWWEWSDSWGGGSDWSRCGRRGRAWLWRRRNGKGWGRGRGRGGRGCGCSPRTSYWWPPHVFGRKIWFALRCCCQR
jgi:hypothetical protein